jgi:hypothetical protein
MAGNVSEWVSDSLGGGRGLRGGSWTNLPDVARASSRVSGGPGSRDGGVGCRCAQLLSSRSALSGHDAARTTVGRTGAESYTPRPGPVATQAWR